MADRSLHVGVDGRELLGRPTGVGRYLREVLRAWGADSAFPHRLTVCVPALPDDRAALGPRVEWRVAPATRQGTFWEQWILPRALAAAGADVLFAPAYTAPLRQVCPAVVVIHDVSFSAHPEWFTWRDGVRRRWLTRATARRAARVLTVSEVSAGEITRWLGVPRSRLALAPPGGPAWRDLPAAPRDPVVLHVGSLFNRRRIPLLIEGFALAARTRPGLRLVLVGSNRTHPHVDPHAFAARLGVADRVDWRDYVDDATLESLYASAAVAAFLSDYEGFGIPPLEALAHGVPPVVLDTAVSREVYGDAAVRVPPTAAGVADGLGRLLDDEAARSACLVAGRARLDRFTWARTAAAVRTALEAVVP